MAILDVFTFIKYYESKEFLQDCLKEGMSARDIGKYCHVSYKLINLWLVKHGLATRTPEMKFP
jgi:transposase-like protein